MFKKLKQKINEEQSPQRNVLSPQQAQVKALGKSPGLHQDAPSSSSDRELLAGMIAEPAFLSEYTIFALDHSNRPKAAQVPSANITKGAVSSPSGSVNGDGAASPLREESQSLAQKLQQRVSSVESLFRVSGRAEGLFRSGSRDSLVRSASRESLTPLGENEAPGAPAFDPPSDIESEAEDAPGNTEALSKEQLLYRLHRVEKSLANYRGKYSELVTAYRTVQRDKEKTQAILGQSQDKALRRIGELREELQMDQQAKKHLQEEFDAALEEKDQMITVLQTQVALMKKRIHGCPEALVSPEAGDTQTADSPEMTSDTQSTTQVESVELNQAWGSGEPGSTADLEVLQKRVRRQETLLQRCKELINSNKERSAQLSSENDALQQQLQERLQELEKMKELHTSEKTKLITQLRDAKNLIEQLEQDKGMVIAETKRQMHETLEMKEEEIAQLRTRIQQTVAQKEELQEQREKAEKAAFEELERALGMAQRAEEARRQLQERMEEQVKQVEQASEEERRSLQQELTRVKQEVITIMKKSAEDRIAEMERQHLEDLAKKDKQMRNQINEAVENCRKELLKAAQEKEQQASLAVEEAELQKSAVQAEGEAKARELQLELESARTRILELESSLAKSSQGEATQADQFLAETEEQRKKYEGEIAALEERHQQELEKLKAEQTDTLNQQHATAVEELVQKHKSEIDVIMKDKELEFQDHVKEMNQKMLEKLDIKQAELEALSSELSEMQKCKEQLEEKLAADAANESVRRESEVRLKEEQLKFQMEVDDIKRQHEQLLEGLEKTLKEELNQLRMVLEEKDKELEQYVVRERILQEDAKKAQQDVGAKLKEIEDLRCVAQSEKEALAEAGAQYNSLKEELEQSKSQVQNLERLLEVGRNDCQQKEESLQQKTNENEELKQRIQQALNDLAEKENSHAQSQQAVQEELNRLNKQLDEEKSSYEKRAESLRKEMDSKLKSQETKMEKLKQKAKEMQEKLKKKLHEQEENAKAEIAKKDKELQQKDQQVKDKILEMAHANSEGLSSALSDLEANHKEQLEKIHEAHRHEQEELLRLWQEKLSQQEEELQEKHALSLQEKVQELEDVSQQFLTNREEKEQVVQEVKNLREELSMRETTVQKLQTELREAAVKLESLSEVEDILKKQLETVEKNLNQALNERNLFQDQLTKTEETSKERFQALSEELEDACKKLNALEASRNKEGEDLQRTLEEKTTELENKETEFLTQICGIRKELEQHCQGAQATLIDFSDHLCKRVEAKVNELQNRITCNQRKLCHFKNVILTKNDKICSLEKELQQNIEESQSLKNSLDQMALQLNANSENLKALTIEKESLQKDANNHSQVLSEKVLCIEKLDEENKNISEKLKANILHISNLESIIDDLKNQLSGTITEKEEAISLLNQQHNEEKQSIRSQMEEAVVRAEKEKGLAVEQVDTLRNKLSELKKKTDTKLTQSHNTIRSLQCKIEDMEKQIAEKDEHLQRLTASIDNQSISKSEMDQVLSEKEQRVSALTLELDNCTKKISELEERLKLQSKEQEQLEAVLQQQHNLRESEKMELMQQLQQTKEQCSHKSDLVCETEEKLQSLEKEFHNVKQQLDSQQGVFEREKAEILKSKEEALKAAEESANKVAELKKKAEQKISLIRKQLTAQIEQKEQTIKDLQAQLEDLKQRLNEKEQQVNSLEENGRKMEEAINNLREEHKKHLEQVQHDGKLEKENPLQTVKDMNNEELAAVTSVQNKAAAATVSEGEEEAFSRLRELEAKLIESEEQNTTRQAEISQLQAELREQMALVQELQKTCLSLEVQVKEKETVVMQMDKCSLEQTNSLLEMEPVQYAGNQDTKLKQEAWESEKDLLVKDYEMKLQDLCKRLEEKEGQLKVQENLQIGLGQTDGECLTDGSKSPENHLQRKLVETENEKQKIQKDYTRLQKDLRSLRKEHEKELEYQRKEMEDESETKLKLELEDLEMKHSSALKQMMREFNTQIALKDKELEASVKEAVEKAQRVEAELMGLHREEANQLQKIISQKDDDLKRTVQRYEQILQSREEEMGTRVWEVQKELEELQQRSLSGPQGVEELQVQLAEKTTLLSEARLKEQEYQDRIHTLEDTVRKAYKNSVVTHLGKEPSHYSADPFTEPTEFEYLRKVMFEYMMGRETKTMAKVITSMLKFPADQAQKVLEREDSRVMPWLR
ncbi:golgin subfamily A member 4 isoform X2 [Pangasianodon hypophthalmus]|uniref:golgin subfamily A member 4 isoform X2 n=1 Tax=Pangasianodon hypophthalmus TaxID=310915 RepID=UPI0023078BB9|nr:golgin subfamily A member 4 isoform X2 [Pangasianodon hypophthalmus]